MVPGVLEDAVSIWLWPTISSVRGRASTWTSTSKSTATIMAPKPLSLTVRQTLSVNVLPPTEKEQDPTVP